MSEQQAQRVLVVDDDPETAHMLGLMLELQGYAVERVNGTAQAINSVNRERPAAVVLDVMMPGVSGLEFCRYVRREPGLADLPIVIVSARARLEDIREGLDAGANEYLTKPIATEELVGALARVLG